MTTEISIPQGLSDLDKLIYLVRISDKADSLTREGLYKVFTEGSWSNRFSSWSEFVQSPDGLNKSESWASKHIATYRHFVLEAGIEPEQLEGVATESLYLARTLPGTPEEQLAMASTLTRRELKETSNESTGHVHSGETVTIYKCCGMRCDTIL
jgi:hypothetical protein